MSATDELEIEAFFTDEDSQTKYVTRVRKLCKKLEKLYPEFDLELHGEMVKQMVRSEIQCYQYEKSTANDKESKIVIQLLGGERVHLRALYTQLLTSLKEIRGDKSSVTVEIPKEFGQHLLIQFGKMADDAEDDDNSDTGRPKNSGNAEESSNT